jgi:hypothetical protein
MEYFFRGKKEEVDLPGGKQRNSIMMSGIKKMLFNVLDLALRTRGMRITSDREKQSPKRGDKHQVAKPDRYCECLDAYLEWMSMTG